MTGPDLRAAQARVEQMMDDRCEIHRDRLGVLDDELDDDTGELVKVDAGAATYTGPCLITPTVEGDGTPEPTSSASSTSSYGGRYRLLLPVGAPAVEGGELLTVTESRRDPQLVGEQFRVDAPGRVSTYVVARIVGLTRLKTPPAEMGQP